MAEHRPGRGGERRHRLPLQRLARQGAGELVAADELAQDLGQAARDANLAAGGDVQLDAERVRLAVEQAAIQRLDELLLGDAHR